MHGMQCALRDRKSGKRTQCPVRLNTRHAVEQPAHEGKAKCNPQLLDTYGEH